MRYQKDRAQYGYSKVTGVHLKGTPGGVNGAFLRAIRSWVKVSEQTFTEVDTRASKSEVPCVVPGDGPR